MITESQILDELKKINQQLSRQNNGAFRNFTAGFFHSFGYFLGTITVFAILAIIASRYNWAAMISKSMETMMSSINWSKIVPAPINQQPQN
ncbi:MAG: hypothetical protein WAV41_04980 [Microgenomates group bacterium]